MTPSTTRYKRGDIVLVPFPFTDLTQIRQRPALVISADWFNDSHPDIVLAAITSQPPQALGRDELLLDHSADLAQAGLPKASIIRMGKLFSTHKSLIRRVLGSLPPTIIVSMNDKLRDVYGL